MRNRPAISALPIGSLALGVLLSGCVPPPAPQKQPQAALPSDAICLTQDGLRRAEREAYARGYQAGRRAALARAQSPAPAAGGSADAMVSLNPAPDPDPTPGLQLGLLPVAQAAAVPTANEEAASGVTTPSQKQPASGGPQGVARASQTSGSSTSSSQPKLPAGASFTSSGPAQPLGN